MLCVIIDGYNLIRQVEPLLRREQKSLEAGRSALIALLKAYRQTRSLKITVVFDGASELSEFAEAYHEGGIAIAYSPSTQSADDVIKEMATKLQARAIVVSSDRSILNHAKLFGCAVIDSVAFYQKLKSASSLGGAGSTEKWADKDDKVAHKRWSTYKKGPSKKLPKKERQNRQKLNKL